MSTSRTLRHHCQSRIAQQLDLAAVVSLRVSESAVVDEERKSSRESSSQDVILQFWLLIVLREHTRNNLSTKTSEYKGREGCGIG